MKEAQVAKDLKVTVKDVAVPEPQANQVIIKVVVSGSNPKDWKIPAYDMKPDFNSGDDIAGYVHSVGPNVYEFKVGDRVASFHEMMTPGGSWDIFDLLELNITSFYLNFDNVSLQSSMTL